MVLSNTYKDPVQLVILGSGEISSHEGMTQGDPLAMAMYALAVTPLIQKLHQHDFATKQVWYADDTTAAGCLGNLRRWWDEISSLGPGYGYYPNGHKMHLIVKPEYADLARSLFEGTGIAVTTTGHRYLGAVVGSVAFREEFVKKRVGKLVSEVKRLTDIARTQPHAAYSAYLHGLTGHWSYLMRTIPDISHQFSDLEEVIHQEFIPALSGRPACSPVERRLLALPARLGGLSLLNPVARSDQSFQTSTKLTAPLVDLIDSQHLSGEVDLKCILDAKKDIKQQSRLSANQEASELEQDLDDDQKRLVALAKEKGSSIWLTSLPIKNHGFFLHKSEFRDALCLRFGWSLPSTPLTCICGTRFEVNHALNCKRGGFPIQTHNEIRDFTANLLTEVCRSANLLTEVCRSVATEPPLQPLEGENFHLRSAITEPDARLDVRARGFWNRSQDAFFDVRVFNPNTPCYRSQSLPQLYHHQERLKKREYNQRVQEVEGGVFTTLVFSTSGGMGREATVFYKRLADFLSRKRDLPYYITMGWLRCLNFALLRSSILCVHGSRSSRYQPFTSSNITLAFVEGRVVSLDNRN